jgi:hypothetical protein
MTAAIAQAQPTLPVPTIPIFMDVSVCHAVEPPAADSLNTPPAASWGPAGNAQLARRVLAVLALVRGEDLLALFVEEEMIVAEVRARHMANGNFWSSSKQTCLQAGY